MKRLLLMTSLFIFFQKPIECSSHQDHCGTIPFPSNTGNVTPDPILISPDVWSFVSDPLLHPMKVKILINKKKSSPGYLFVAPYTGSDLTMYGQTGSLIMASDGTPIWFSPLSSPDLMNNDFRVQKLFGKSVLTRWQGTISSPPGYTNIPSGSPEPGGCFYIIDNSYRVIKTVKARKGFISDIHEFLITPNNTALFLAVKNVPMDLTPYGGPKNGFIQNFSIQEIDLKTDKLIFFWDALEHIPLTDSFESASTATESGNVWDVYHMNSVGLTDKKEDILLSSRNTWTLYNIHKPTGKIIWRLGGKQSDFTFGPGARFSWQHDARFLANDHISVFDDNCCETSDIPPNTPPAHGLILKLDINSMTAKVKHTYFHDPNLQVDTQGNVQSLKTGNKFIGWGQSQYFSEYKKQGNGVLNPGENTVYDALMPGNNLTYRAYRHKWKGHPYYPPKIAAEEEEGQTRVFASWNGSTETAAWKVLAGKNPHHLSEIKEVKKVGFETAIKVNHKGPYFMVKALNKRGKEIGKSQVVKIK